MRNSSRIVSYLLSAIPAMKPQHQKVVYQKIVLHFTAATVTNLQTGISEISKKNIQEVVQTSKNYVRLLKTLNKKGITQSELTKQGVAADF